MQIGWVDFSKMSVTKSYPFYGYLGPKQRWMSWGLELFGMLSPICSFRGSPLCRHEQSIL